jgi:hypothetical protein
MYRTVWDTLRDKFSFLLSIAPVVQSQLTKRSIVYQEVTMKAAGGILKIKNLQQNPDVTIEYGRRPKTAHWVARNWV